MDDEAEPRDESGLTEREFLAAYDPRRFPPMAVTVDVVALALWDSHLSVLLVRRRNHPALGRWALPGGFVEVDEDLEDAARRELEEETGVFSGSPAGVTLRQLRAYGTPGRDPRLRVISVAYLAILAKPRTPRAGSDAASVRFWPVRRLRGADGPPLAFDHDRILADALEDVRSRLACTPLATAFLEEPFTMSALRAVYEEVWGQPQDPETFRRRVLLRRGFLQPVGRPGRPSRERASAEPLYRRGPARLLSPPLSPDRPVGRR